MAINSPDLGVEVTTHFDSATGLRPVAKDDRERRARQPETPAARMPKANWAWAASSGHFDWMDWHTPSHWRFFSPEDKA
jgi:hypothetical protein